ncbi:uncharacterized protein [Diadema setosum]|uniref:uncharacterized protein n=1 Tax=Diadema setosum TaxID=31175 RepID=UPI003B3B34D8
MKTKESELSKLPHAVPAVFGAESSEQESCEDSSPSLACSASPSDTPQQSWHLAVAQDQNNPKGDSQPTVVAFQPTSQRQHPQAITMDPRYQASAGVASLRAQPLSQCQQNFWRPLVSGAQVIPQLPTFLNFNNNGAAQTLAHTLAVNCAPLQRPAVGLVQQVAEAFKQSSKKEMLPSEVYAEMEKVYPYYKHIVGQKRKSWMSSVRHALTTPRFKSRKLSPDEGDHSSRRGCRWSLNENWDESTAAVPSIRRRSSSGTPRGAARRKQRLLGNTRNEYPQPVYHMTRANPIIFQQQQQQQQLPAQITPQPQPQPLAHPMQATFSPGPTGPVHQAASNMYYQAYRSPAVGYMIGGQKFPLQQTALPQLNLGQWNMSGFPACNPQQQQLFSNTGYFGQTNDCVQALQNNTAFNQAISAALVNQNNHNNSNSGTPVMEAPMGQARSVTIQPRPVSIHMTEQHAVPNNDECAEAQQVNQNQGFLNNQSESDVHAEIKQELRNLVYESLDICNGDGERSNETPSVEHMASQTMQQNALNINRSPSSAKPRPPHHAQGGFHNYAWSPLTHQQRDYQENIHLAPTTQGEQQGEGSSVETRVISDLDGQLLIEATVTDKAQDNGSSAD